MNTFLILGIALFSGLIASFFIKKLKLPQVIAHISIGVILGISGFKVFNIQNLEHFEIVSHFALGIIGFVIGGELRWARIRAFGLNILAISLLEATCAFALVFGALYFFTHNIVLSLIIGALASATAPAGTTNVIQEYKARGQLTSTLFGVVGLDDTIAIIIYALAINIAKMLLTHSHEIHPFLIIESVSIEIFGSILLGISIGAVLLFLSRKFRDDDAKLIISLSAILLGIGVAMSLGLSPILSSMALGSFLSNTNMMKNKSYFTSISKLSIPIYILFFVLVGAHLDIKILSSIGMLGILYIIFRVLGKYIGAYLGAVVSRAPKNVRKYLGICLFPQAGVAIGLALAAQHDLVALSASYKSLGLIIINTITATTFVFQFIGPIFTKIGLQKAGECSEN
ncbi:cation:proton antiporter [Candidatus Margulisiibacteriota bacterium]